MSALFTDDELTAAHGPPEEAPQEPPTMAPKRKPPKRPDVFENELIPADESEAARGLEEAPPSPEEIRRRCLEQQKGWSPRERLKRAGIYGRQSVWTAPTCTVCEMD